MHENTGRETAPTREVLDALRRMTARVRVLGSGLATDPSPGLEAGPGSDSGSGWWVLALGEEYADAGLDRRDELRERLREQVERAGLVPAEFVWVWDESERAQLVVAVLPSRERAERVAGRLRARGLDVRVIREME
jgi:hypothetical protein